MFGSKKCILGIGGANLDVHVAVLARPIPGDSNISKISTSPGGVMRNVLENLSLLGEDCSLISAVGEDLFAGSILASCEKAGIDCSGVYRSPELKSSCYVSMLGEDGEMLIAGSDMEVLESMPPEHILAQKEAAGRADIIALDGNLTEKQIEAALKLAEGRPVFADTVSTAKALRFVPFLDRISLIKPNLIELEAMSGLRCASEEDIKRACTKLLIRGCGAVAVSLGERGCYYAGRSGKSFFRELGRSEKAVNANGCGDAFMAGLIYGSIHGMSPEESADCALACGSLALASSETIHPAMSADLIKETISKYRN